uniref:helix-turn-helix domain-containing protein n=1 Tax=Acetatifactor sp. TaxID=1872090 RepID=UPI00405722F0
MIYGLGERLYERRMLKKLSQKEVANIINVSASVVSNYEKGERTPSLEILMALARLYQCSTDYLLGFEKPDKSKLVDVSMLSDEQIGLLQKFLYELRK